MPRLPSLISAAILVVGVSIVGVNQTGAGEWFFGHNYYVPSLRQVVHGVHCSNLGPYGRCNPGEHRRPHESGPLYAGPPRNQYGALESIPPATIRTPAVAPTPIATPTPVPTVVPSVPPAPAPAN